jgi:exopolysaccharide production protein ExoQ
MSALATVICVLLVVYLFRVEARSSDVPRTLWIPLLWMFLAGSRYVSGWLSLSSSASTELYMDMEGSPVDALVFFILMAAGVIVLFRRRLRWGKLLTQNGWIVAFFLFSVLSITWSDNPLISSKRLVKCFGTVIMALVILTERRPYAAVVMVLRRLAFLTLPLSVVFIKYIPEFGRAYHMGIPMFTGVSSGKNGLGQLCLLGGIYAWASLLHRSHDSLTLGGRIRVDVLFLVLIAWLLTMANSATSLVCLGLAAGLLLLSRVPAMVRSPQRIMTLAMVSLLLVGVLNLTVVDLSDTAVASLNRDPTLTTRIPMWRDLLGTAPNPLVGAGYESFWSSKPGLVMRARWEVFQAHNGYLEQYLNLGIIGLTLLLVSMVSGLFKIWYHLPVDFHSAVLRLCFVLTVAFYNWTEATLYGISNTWLLLLVGIIEIRGSVSSGEVVGAHRLKGPLRNGS